MITAEELQEAVTCTMRAFSNPGEWVDLSPDAVLAIKTAAADSAQRHGPSFWHVENMEAG